ncbi:hypothetical protein Nepgr_033852 [Nepenthes gracilis]|uniref:Uncharacterized protein n=1 Tax=Nepenthes gracilis TaxID=150966 RepID=A0AAD3Y789_NEPGR|nr:hypothetical protein Nepgr_033852 [Nepenthes gracilis]
MATAGTENSSKVGTEEQWHVRIANSSASRPSTQMQRTEKKTKQPRPTDPSGKQVRPISNRSAGKDRSIFIDTHSRSGSRHSTSHIATADGRQQNRAAAWDFHNMQEITSPKTMGRNLQQIASEAAAALGT